MAFWTFGLYIQPLEDEFGWSRAEVSLGFSFSILASGLVAPLIGRWIDSVGPRRVIFVGTILATATTLLLATTASLWQWYFYLAIAAAARQMILFLPFQALVVRWFERRRGLAVGVLAMGFSLGGFAVVPFMRVVIDTVDWDGSFLVAGALAAAFLLPLAVFVIRDHPAEVGLRVDGGPVRREASSVAPPRSGLTAAQAVRTPLFWVLALAIAAFFFGLVGWMVHAVPYYEAEGYSAGWAVGLFAIAAGGAMLSRPIFGYLSDRLRTIEPAAMVLCAFLSGGLVVLLISGGSPVGVALFLLLWIIGSGGGPMLEPLLLLRAFGLAHFATILGFFMVIETIGMIISPTAAGAIFDATGSYDWALVMLLGSFVAAFFLFWLAARLPRPVLPVAPVATAAAASDAVDAVEPRPAPVGTSGASGAGA